MNVFVNIWTSISKYTCLPTILKNWPFWLGQNDHFSQNNLSKNHVSFMAHAFVVNVDI
jgi:hypothetical protein